MMAPGLAAIVSAEAEGVAGRVEEHPDIVLRLFRSDRGSEGHCLGDRGVQVSDLEVEVHHRALLPVGRWPYRGLVASRLLEYDIDGSFGRDQDCRAWLLMANGPPEQSGVEPRQSGRVRRLDSGSPPHAFRSRSHRCTFRVTINVGRVGTLQPVTAVLPSSG